jgi:hypothetical protein
MMRTFLHDTPTPRPPTEGDLDRLGHGDWVKGRALADDVACCTQSCSPTSTGFVIAALRSKGTTCAATGLPAAQQHKEELPCRF